MCEECHCSICPSGCPNAPEYKPGRVYTCEHCEKPIYDGEDCYMLYNGTVYCEECCDYKVAEKG